MSVIHNGVTEVSRRYFGSVGGRVRSERNDSKHNGRGIWRNKVRRVGASSKYRGRSASMQKREGCRSEGMKMGEVQRVDIEPQRGNWN